MHTVLIIDDNPGVGEALSLLLSLRDIKALYAATPDDGLALLARQPVDLVIQDMNFSADTTSGEEGVALFRALRQRSPDLPVILLTAWTRLESAVELVGGSALFRANGIERLIRDIAGAPFHPLPEKKQQQFTARVALGLPPVG